MEACMDGGTVSKQHLINKQVPVITVFVADIRQCILQGLVVLLPLIVSLGMVGRRYPMFSVHS